MGNAIAGKSSYCIGKDDLQIEGNRPAPGVGLRSSDLRQHETPHYQLTMAILDPAWFTDLLLQNFLSSIQS